MTDFFILHFLVVPKEILKAIKNFAIFIFHFFSVDLLFKTLFSPWKRKIVQREGVGFDLSEWFTVLTFNLISRGIGAFIRLFVISLTLLVEISTLVFGIFFLIFSLVIPLVTLLALLSQNKKRIRKELIRRVNNNDLLTFILEFIKSKRGQFLFNRLGVPPQEISKKITEEFSLQKGKIYSLKFLETQKESEIFCQLYENVDVLKNCLQSFNLDLEDIEHVLLWFDREEEEKEKERRFWELDNLLRKKALGIYWSYGYTVNLDRYSTDFTQEQPFSPHLVGRNKEVAQIENILARESQSNVILIGEEGVGKRTIIFQLANNIREGKIFPSLKHKRVLEIDVNAILGEGKDLIGAQNTFQKVIAEAATAGNIVLLIPNFDLFICFAEGRIDLTAVFEKFANGSALQIIGLTTPDRYQKYIYPNTSIGKLFNKVEVEAPNQEQAIEILENFATSYEKSKKVYVSYQAIKEAVEKSNRYITDIPYPEKAIDLLDEAVVLVAMRKKEVVTVKEVDQVLSEKTKIPVGEISKEEKDKLIDLENVIHKRLIDQEEAVNDLANAFRRARLQLGQRKKPAGVFLFLGPTGVGKTETAKALAEAYFGSEERLIRFDMNEFQDATASTRLLGYFEKNEPGILIKALRENPFCVLLLDEIEKASKNVLNLFLTAFDEGYLTDNFGKKISLQEMIIVCTSNAGAEFIRQKINQEVNVKNFKKELIDNLLKESVFLPEFINRFDSVVVYKPLTRENLEQIARLLLEKLNERLSVRGIKIKITDSLLQQVAKQGFDPVFGARPMKRLIQDKIEAPLAQKILRGEISKGEEIMFSLE